MGRHQVESAIVHWNEDSLGRGDAELVRGTMRIQKMILLRKKGLIDLV